MRTTRNILVIAAACLAGGAAPASALSPDARITTAGLGPVRIGMTAAQVERAAHHPVGRTRAGRCREFIIGRRVVGLFTGHRLARIDVRSRRYATRSGVRVGHSEKSVLSTYRGRLVRVSHKYNRGWSHLQYTDGNRRVVFTTDGSRVREISTGRRPEIDLVEGCG